MALVGRRGHRGVGLAPLGARGARRLPPPRYRATADKSPPRGVVQKCHWPTQPRSVNAVEQFVAYARSHLGEILELRGEVLCQRIRQLSSHSWKFAVCACPRLASVVTFHPSATGARTASETHDRSPRVEAQDWFRQERVQADGLEARRSAPGQGRTPSFDSATLSRPQLVAGAVCVQCRKNLPDTPQGFRPEIMLPHTDDLPVALLQRSADCAIV